MDDLNDSASASRRRGTLIMAALLATGVLGTVLLHVTGWDRSWPAAFYTPGHELGNWAVGHQLPWSLLYDSGDVPAFLLVLMSLGVLGATALKRAPRSWRRPSAVVLLTVVLGPGILVNGLLKPYWGRPRPHETMALGGQLEYRPIWRPGTPQRGCSFTCGHCALAFSVSSVASWVTVHPTARAAVVLGGVAYGGLMGAARIVQGGHFPTDVLWSGVLVLLILTTLHYHVLRIPETRGRTREPPPLGTRTRRTLVIGCVVAPAAMALLAHPVYELRFHDLDDRIAGARLVVLLAADGTEVARAPVEGGRAPLVRTLVRGVGPLWASVREELDTRVDGDTALVGLRVAGTGWLYWSTTEVSLQPG
jgi:membrane-associated PAP2 superfamily phosphatase